MRKVFCSIICSQAGEILTKYEMFDESCNVSPFHCKELVMKRCASNRTRNEMKPGVPPSDLGMSLFLIHFYFPT